MKEKKPLIIFDELKSKHSQTYNPVQLHLWARMISLGLHESTNDPPNVPMISGNLPKCSKQDTGNSATSVIIEAVAKALAPQSPSLATTSSPTVCTSSTSPSSPIKLAEERMKKFEQLKFLQQLYDSGALTVTEFNEQKNIILTCLE